MKWLRIFLFTAAICFFFGLSFHSIIEFDQDLGRHLLFGKLIFSQGSVPGTNLLSSTFPNFPFINSHWLSEVVFYVISSMLGIKALLILKVIVITAAFSLTLHTAFRYSKSLLATALSFVIFAPVLLERTEIRPEIFSYLFTAIFMYVFLLDKKRVFFLLPLIELMWVNSHIYFIIGPILSVIFFRRRYWYITLLVCVATLVNPNFISGALYPFTVLQNYGYSIVENQTIFFLQQVTSNPNIIFFEIAVGISLIGLFLCNFKKITWQHLLLLGLTILPITAIRSFPFFFLIELPVIAYLLSEMREPFKRNLVRFSSLIIIGCIVLTLIRSLRLMSNEYYLSRDSQKRFGTELMISGKGALDFVERNHLTGPIFNNFDNGSYIAYRLYPREKVFVDGRPEAYPKESFQEVYIPMQMTKENFEIVDQKYHFKTIIFSHTDGTPWGQAFLTHIINNPDFRLVYLDSYSVVLTKGGSLAEITEESLLTMKTNYLQTLYLARVAALFGWNSPSEQLVQKSRLQNANSQFVSDTKGLVLF